MSTDKLLQARVLRDGADGKTILPTPGERNVLITSALPYVNNVPHLGNIIGSVLSGDAFARYCRGRGLNTLYICGTDEYGTTTEARAIAEGCTPQELCDKYHSIHAQVYDWFNIGFDFFGRTTTTQQTCITQDIFLKLRAYGLLEERVTTQLFCPQHEAFLADRFVEGECPHCRYADARGDQCDLCGQLLDPLELRKPRCKLDGATPYTKQTKHIFMALDRLQPEIDAFYTEASQKGVWSGISKDITSAWLKQGLQARSITRDMRWGTQVPLPGYEDKVIYPWFDACIGYASITANYTEDWEKWWRNPDDVELYQFLGKDNVVFHSVVFPGTQIGSRDTWTKLNHLSATEYLTYEGGKFSKSRGIGVFGDSAKLTGVPSDSWRFYLLSQRPENSDSEFNWDSLISSNNNLLLKNLGNFVNRTMKFLNSRHFQSVVPDFTEYHEPSFDLFEDEVNILVTQYIQELDAVKLRAGSVTIMQISSRGNAFLQSSGLDNKLAEANRPKCAAVIGLAVNLVHLLAALISPYIPETAKAINSQLRTDQLVIPDQWKPDNIKPGHQVGEARYLFATIKAEKAEEWRQAFGDGEARKQKDEALAKKSKKKTYAKSQSSSK